MQATGTRSYVDLLKILRHASVILPDNFGEEGCEDGGVEDGGGEDGGGVGGRSLDSLFDVTLDRSEYERTIDDLITLLDNIPPILFHNLTLFLKHEAPSSFNIKSCEGGKTLINMIFPNIMEKQQISHSLYKKQSMARIERDKQRWETRINRRDDQSSSNI